MTKSARTSSSRRTPAATARTADSLTALVERNYATLRGIARRELVARKLQRTMTPTSLVAESVVRLIKQRKRPRSGSQLCGLATIMMTRAIADRARRVQAGKRRGGARPMPIDQAIADGLKEDLRTAPAMRLPASPTLRGRLITALETIAEEHPREIEVITLHLVLGIDIDRTAELVGVSRRTAYRSLETGLAHLRAHLELDPERETAG